MEHNSRMKEITGNLKQDVKDLLGESASLFTGFFKRGACTVRAVADKWKTFAHGISEAVDELMKPPFAEGGPEAPAPLLNSKDEPIVTVVESADEHFPEKLQMPLSQAERRVLQIDELYRAHDLEPQPVKVKIDYMKNGQTDRYFLPLQIGAGGSLLHQMKRHIDAYQASRENVDQLFRDAPEEYREALRSELTPFLHQSLDSLSGKLLPYFQWHCDMGEFEKQLEEQADMLPENEQGPFRSGVREALDALRQSLNLGIVAEPPPLYREQPSPVQEAGRAPNPIPDMEKEQPRASVKVRLQQHKKAAKKQPPLYHGDGLAPPPDIPGEPYKSEYDARRRRQEDQERRILTHKSKRPRRPKPHKGPER